MSESMVLNVGRHMRAFEHLSRVGFCLAAYSPLSLWIALLQQQGYLCLCVSVMHHIKCVKYKNANRLRFGCKHKLAGASRSDLDLACYQIE